jgi:hypothetical protein
MIFYAMEIVLVSPLRLPLHIYMYHPVVVLGLGTVCHGAMVHAGMLTKVLGN